MRLALPSTFRSALGHALEMHAAITATASTVSPGNHIATTGGTQDGPRRPEWRQCFNCGRQGHLALSCRNPCPPRQEHPPRVPGRAGSRVVHEVPLATTSMCPSLTPHATVYLLGIGQCTDAIIDTGAGVCVIDAKLLRSAGRMASTTDCKELLLSPNGSHIPYIGRIELTVETLGESGTLSFFVVENLNPPVILGCDWCVAVTCSSPLKADMHRYQRDENASPVVRLPMHQCWDFVMNLGRTLKKHLCAVATSAAHCFS